MITFKHHGDFRTTERFLSKAKKQDNYRALDMYGKRGVALLSSATPIDTGQTSQSWSYSIENKNGSISLSWSNSNMENGVPVVILIQYGHGTKTGGYVSGRDFINPVIRPLFDSLVENIWEEVIR